MFQNLAIGLLLASPPHSFDVTSRTVTSDTISDIRAVIHDLSHTPKTEFETASQFTKRLSNLTGHIYAFTFEPSEVVYEAERQRFHIRTHSSNPRFGHETDWSHVSLAVRLDHTVLGQHTGVNAFGVTKTITDVKIVEYCVYGRKSLLHLPEYALDYYLSIPASRAAILKPQLRFVLVCRTAVAKRGVVQLDTYHSDATIDSPVDREHQAYYIACDSIALWACDRSSGEVLAKFQVLGPSKAA